MPDEDHGFVFEGFDAPGQREAVEQEIARAVAAIGRGEYDPVLRASGIDPAAAAALDPSQFELDAGQNLTGLELTAVGLALHAGARLTEKALGDIWKKIILPRLEAKYGPRVRRRGR